jgi:hypothetical protein
MTMLKAVFYVALVNIGLVLLTSTWGGINEVIPGSVISDVTRTEAELLLMGMMVLLGTAPR